MKKIILTAITVIALCACTKTQNTVLTIDTALEQCENTVGDTITLEGMCTHLCKHSGRKMFLMGSDNSKIIRIEAGELGQFPGECARNTVRVKGVVNETRIDEEFLQNWEQKVAANGGEKHGETAGGCSTEKTAQGETANTTEGRIADFRQKIEERNQTEGKNYLSFYFVTAQEYEIIAAE